LRHNGEEKRNPVRETIQEKYLKKWRGKKRKTLHRSHPHHLTLDTLELNI
jgi:hypothetical protein